jgi:hypothetical protein
LLTASVFAASDSGTVSYVNAYTGTVRLSDGATHYVPNRVSASKVRQGDVMRIQYDRDGTSRLAREISRTGSKAAPVITPTRGEGVDKNLLNRKSTMCDPRPDNNNPCFLGT